MNNAKDNLLHQAAELRKEGKKKLGGADEFERMARENRISAATLFAKADEYEEAAEVLSSNGQPNV